MINKLESMLPEIQESLHYEGWGSLIINRRRPITTRIFKRFDDVRVCLHIFEPCTDEEAFMHPHPWPGAFLVLKGEYIQTIGVSPNLQDDPFNYYKEVVRPYTAYEITDPLVWHKIQPTKRTYTIMINGPEWEGHDLVKTTKGKDLDKLSNQDINDVKWIFNSLIEKYLRSV